MLKSLKLGPTAPRVVLLPDHRFFVRSIPVASGATTAEVAAQVEVALETLSPFPTAQLYHGYFWTPGSTHVLVFASYRKRFSAEQTAEWSNAELVIPTFASMAAVGHQPATTLFLPSADGLTAIHWENGAVPSRVIARSLPLDADEAQRSSARGEILNEAGGTRAVVDLSGPPEITVSPDEKSLLFRSGEFTAALPVSAAAALDVRDKDELAAMRRAKRRDLILWRVFAGCAILLGLLLLGEIALLAIGHPWQKTVIARVSAQQPVVDKIMTAQALSSRIEDLSTKRLLPLEMLYEAKFDPVKRGTIVFSRVTANVLQGLYTLRIEGQAQNAGEFNVYRNLLSELPTVSDVRVERQTVRAGMTDFVLVVTFKPGAIVAASSVEEAQKPAAAGANAANKNPPPDPNAALQDAAKAAASLNASGPKPAPVKGATQP